MDTLGRSLFIAGLAIAAGSGVLVSLYLGAVCRIDPQSPPTTIWNYTALCFATWAYSVPVGLILAATGAALSGGASGRRALLFGLGLGALYVAVTIANDPIPHIPPAFGVGGSLILLFYGLILWTNRTRLAQNRIRLAGYTLLVIGFWFTCGLASRNYQPYFGAAQSPIDIMFYFAAGMGLLWLGERAEVPAPRHSQRERQHPAPAE